MNIKEHIEAGHYERFLGYPESGIGVPTRGAGTAQVFTTKCGGLYPLVGVVSIMGRGWVSLLWTEDGCPERNSSHWGANYDLLPPPPRKVKVTAYMVIDGGGNIQALHRWDSNAAGDLRVAYPNGRVVTLTGEYEEPYA